MTVFNIITLMLREKNFFQTLGLFIDSPGSVVLLSSLITLDHTAGQNCVNVLSSSSFKPKSCFCLAWLVSVCFSLLQADLILKGSALYLRFQLSSNSFPPIRTAVW